MTEHFSIAEQARIRSAIIAYAKAHEIGVIILARRIREADPKDIEIPIKTLQRFLKGETIRNDAALNALARFAEKLEDPVTAMGVALHRLHATPTTTDISGDYTITRNNIECPVQITKESDFWRMIERDRDRHRIYEGVVIHMTGVFVAHLKDRAFGLPRHYHFRLLDPGFFCDIEGADQIDLRKANHG